MRQRRDQLKDIAEEGSSNSNKDSVIFRRPFRGYTETLRCSVVTASPILRNAVPFEVALRVWRPSKADAEAFRGFRG